MTEVRPRKREPTHARLARERWNGRGRVLKTTQCVVGRDRVDEWTGGWVDGRMKE